jgi:hypothetical protein
MSFYLIQLPSHLLCQVHYSLLCLSFLMQTFSVSCVLLGNFWEGTGTANSFNRNFWEMLRGIEKSRINYKLLTSNSWNLRFIKSSRKKCFPHTRICRLAGFLNNKTFSQAFLLSIISLPLKMYMICTLQLF